MKYGNKLCELLGKYLEHYFAAKETIVVVQSTYKDRSEI